MAYYSTHSISQFLSNYEKQRVRFLLAHPVYMRVDNLSRLPVMPPSTFDVNWLQVQPQRLPVVAMVGLGYQVGLTNCHV